MAKRRRIDLDTLVWWDGKADPTQSEVWAILPGFNSCYAASSMGRIVRLCSGHGTVPGRLLTPSKDGKGRNGAKDWLQVRLSVDNKPKTRFVHRLVASTFLNTEYRWCDVHHIDNDPWNNVLANLEWQDSVDHRQAAAEEHRRTGGWGGRQYGAQD